jgi:myo-inositol-1(or 4)-monophosphatase
MNPDQIQQTAIKAAYRGADVLRDLFGRIGHIERKGAIDLVTEADRGSEKAILGAIQSHFPGHAVLAEESGSSETVSEYLWIIDPLDGTTNYANRLPFYAISIAFAVRAETRFGLVLNPVSGELFTAHLAQGACLNGHPIATSAVRSVADSLLATGFPYNLHECHPSILQRFSRCLMASLGVRRLGSAALDLCFVACGRFSGFWEENLKPWDTAAGSLIAAEAGAAVTDFSGQAHQPAMKEILATNGRIHPEMLELLKLEENFENR